MCNYRFLRELLPPLTLPVEGLLLGRVVDGFEYERFIEGLLTAFGNEDSFFEDLVFCLAKPSFLFLPFVSEYSFFEAPFSFLAKFSFLFFIIYSTCSTLPTPYLEVIFFSKFLDLVFDRVVSFFNVDELEALLLLDTLLLYLEPLGPLT